MRPTIPLLFRPAGDGDLAYVVRTWIESYRDEQPEMRTSDYEPWMRSRINANVLLAVHESEPEAIVGWIATDPPAYCVACMRPMEPTDRRPCGGPYYCVPDKGTGVHRLHYCYVRRRYRGKGVGRALFEQVTGGIVGGETVVTHLTNDGRAIKKAKPGRFRYLPQ